MRVWWDVSARGSSSLLMHTRKKARGIALRAFLCLTGCMGLSRIKEAESLDAGIVVMKRLIAEHHGLIKWAKLRVLTARELKVSVSYMPYYINYAAYGAKELKHDWRTDYVYLAGTDLEALMKAIKDDPWKGYPEHEWALNGYRVDDEVADILQRVRGGEDVTPDLENLLERLRARKFDVSAKEE